MSERAPFGVVGAESNSEGAGEARELRRERMSGLPRAHTQGPCQRSTSDATRWRTWTRLHVLARVRRCVLSGARAHPRPRRRTREAAREARVQQHATVTRNASVSLDAVAVNWLDGCLPADDERPPFPRALNRLLVQTQQFGARHPMKPVGIASRLDSGEAGLIARLAEELEYDLQVALRERWGRGV